MSIFKKLSNEEFYHLINFGPCVMITSGYKGRYNAAPIAWNAPVNDDPPLLSVAIADSHFTKELIEKSKEFVVNVPNAELIPSMMYCGKCSGRDTDKLTTGSIKTEPGFKIKIPHIKECVGFIECTVKDTFDYDGVKLFIGNVVYVGVKENLYENKMLTESARVIQHIGGKVFSTPKYV